MIIKSVFGAACACLIVVSINVNAAALINDGSITLTIDQGVGECIAGGVFPDCDYGAFTEVSGSFWYFDTFSSPNPDRALSSNVGIVLGAAQPFDAVPEENMMNQYGGGIFNDPSFFYTTTPTLAVSDTEIDFSGLRWVLDSFSDIEIVGDAFATISCGGCNIGDRYTLDYNAHSLPGNTGGIGETQMAFHLEGTIVSTVPVPAAVWLFGSGIIGLIGVARRKQA